MTDTQVDCVVTRRGKAVTATFHERIGMEHVQRVFGAALGAFGRDGRVKVAPRVAATTRHAFFVVASTEDPMGLREQIELRAAEILSNDPEL